MTIVQWVVIAILAIPLALIATNRLRVDVASLIMAIALGIAQFAGLPVLGAANSPSDAVKAISGLSQPAVITLFGLFIMTRTLDKTGVTRAIARRVLALGGRSETRLIFLFTTATALLSLFMNNLAAGILLLPSAMSVARQTGIKPSKLLMPVAYGSLLGGAATYFTTANIIASDLLTTAHPPQAPLHIWDFTPTGGLIAIAGIIFLTLFGRRLLPDRDPKPEQVMARRTGSELETMYALDERLWEARALPGSKPVGKSLQNLGIGERLGVSIPAIWRGRQALFSPSPDEEIRTNDILLVVGREERVAKLTDLGFQIGRENANGNPISTRGVSFVEVILAPHSQAEGHTIKQLEFRKKYGFTAVALLRDERSYRTDVASMPLCMGDSILMVGSRQRLRRLQSNPDFIVLESDVSDQPVQLPQAAQAVAIVLAALLASILGMPVYLAMMIGAMLMILSGLLAIEEAYRTMEWQAIFLIAGMYSVSLAMVNTGLADLIGSQILNVLTPLGPLGLAAGSYLLAGLLTQVMGGQVTTLVTGPIVISAAITMHTNPQAIAVATAIGCSTAFLTPVAHPVNILMIGPGNYRFNDFFHTGWGLTILCFIMFLIGMALFWRL